MACEARAGDHLKAFLEIKQKEGTHHSFTAEEINHWTQQYGFRPIQDEGAAAIKRIIASTESGLVYFVRELDAHNSQGLHLPSMAPFIKYWVADEFDHQLGTVFVMSIQDDLPSDFGIEQKGINLAEFSNRLGLYSGPLEVLVYTMIQELLTQRAYQQAIRYLTGGMPRLDPLNCLNPAEKTQVLDPFLADYYRPIAREEGYHHGVFLSAFKAHLQNKPDRLAMVYNCLKLFKMPGSNWPNMPMRAAIAAAAGIYSPVQEWEIIYKEIVCAKLDFENLPTTPGSIGEQAKGMIRELYQTELKKRERLEYIMKKRVARAYKNQAISPA